MQQGNIPANMAPGTKIIVRHRANGDTEYICRPDDSTFYFLGASSSFVKIILLLIAIAIVWRLLPASAVEKSRRLPASEKIELVNQ